MPALSNVTSSSGVLSCCAGTVVQAMPACPTMHTRFPPQAAAEWSALQAARGSPLLKGKHTAGTPASAVIHAFACGSGFGDPSGVVGQPHLCLAGDVHKADHHDTASANANAAAQRHAWHILPAPRGFCLPPRRASRARCASAGVGVRGACRLRLFRLAGGGSAAALCAAALLVDQPKAGPRHLRQPWLSRCGSMQGASRAHGTSCKGQACPDSSWHA